MKAEKFKELFPDYFMWQEGVLPTEEEGEEGLSYIVAQNQPVKVTAEEQKFLEVVFIESLEKCTVKLTIPNSQESTMFIGFVDSPKEFATILKALRVEFELKV